MLAELRMKLAADKERVGSYQSSNLQGVLMEHLKTSYAEKLHEQGLKPYSQYIAEAQQEWVVKTFTKEAYQEIILPLMNEEFSEFCIEKKETQVKIEKKELKTIRKQELLEEFYSGNCERFIHLEFLTPTAFKSDGKYIIMPEVKYIYQSLMNKYSAASDDMEMYDEETLEQLVKNSSIVQYKLRSAFFPMEGIKIPAFKGGLCIKVSGTGTMAKYARLLARFGEYSGIGIKAAIGMGALQIKEAKR